jgi:hypothetical protein
MGLILYDENKTNLSEVPFVRDTLAQEKIRNINSYDLIKQIGMLLSKIKVQMGIKHEISDVYKTDIREMIQNRFKNLSLNEIDYAFKLERYGEYKDEKGLESRTEHFHDFNTVYCSTVLGKYVEWKRNLKLKHNISKIEKPVSATEKEKQFWINKGVNECLDYFEEHRSIMDGKLYIYEVFYDMDLLPKDPDYKKKMYADAKEVVEFEIQSTKPTNLAHRKSMDQTLKEIQRPKSGILINKAKELVLLDFLRKLFRDVNEVKKLKEKFMEKP